VSELGHSQAALRKVPTAVRFLSVEPLLGPVDLNLTGISWVIVGGESGPGARLMNPNCARDIRDACRRSDVPFFLKQWGGRTPKAGGRQLDGQTWDQYPRGRISDGIAATGHELST
jgi:protein gp37